MSYFSLSTNIDVSMYFNDYKIQYCIATLPFIYAVAFGGRLAFYQCYALLTASMNILVHIYFLIRAITFLEVSTCSRIAKSKDMLILNVDLYTKQ